MAERANERSEGMFVKAAIILRENLRSHKATGNIIAALSEDPEGFSSDFSQAETPRDVLSAVSRYGSSDQRSKVALIVDGWVNHGNNRNTTVIGQIIRRDFQRWSKSLEAVSN